MKDEDINFVFEQNPDLARIGTKEQYEKYLKTIFPESKVKDIVYHRGPEKIERFYRSKIKTRNGKRFYFSPFNTYRYGQQITQALLNIKNLAIPYDDNFLDDVNKKHPEYTEGKSKWFHLPSHIYVDADKYGYDGVADFDGSSNDEYSVYSPNQIHILGSKKDIKGFKKHVKNSKKTLENKVMSIIFGASFILSFFLLSSNITGNVIGNITKAGSSLIGIILFLSSLGGFFIYRKLRG